MIDGRLFRLGLLCAHLSRVALRIIKANHMYLVYKTFQGRNLSIFLGSILENRQFSKYILTFNLFGTSELPKYSNSNVSLSPFNKQKQRFGELEFEYFGGSDVMNKLIIWPLAQCTSSINKITDRRTYLYWLLGQTVRSFA